jgi:hypothetical protein
MIRVLFDFAEKAYEAALLTILTHTDEVERLLQMHSAFERIIH